MTVFDKEAVVESLDDCIKTGDHLGGKVYELVVEFPVVLFDVRPQYLKGNLLPRVKLVQLIVVSPFRDMLPAN